MFASEVEALTNVTGNELGRKALDTHRSEVFVEEFDVAMDDLEGEQLVVVMLHTAAEVEACVPVTHDYA